MNEMNDYRAKSAGKQVLLFSSQKLLVSLCKQTYRELDYNVATETFEFVHQIQSYI